MFSSNRRKHCTKCRILFEEAINFNTQANQVISLKCRKTIRIPES